MSFMLRRYSNADFLQFSNPVDKGPRAKDVIQDWLITRARGRLNAREGISCASRIEFSGSACIPPISMAPKHRPLAILWLLTSRSQTARTFHNLHNRPDVYG